MGKTKTVLVTGLTEEQKSGKESYEERRKRKEAQKKAEAEKAKIEGLGLKGGQRIKIVGGEIPPLETVKSEETPTPESKVKKKKKKSQHLLLNRFKLCLQPVNPASHYH